MRKTNEIRICQNCGDEFHPHYLTRNMKPQRFCSNKCYLHNRWGEPRLNFCPVCGKPATSTGGKNQIYCSLPCRYIGRKGKKNPKRSNRITKQCAWCGNDVTRPASDFHAEKTFCNYDCMAEWQSEFSQAENHPRWKGGPPRSYGIGWKKARQTAMDKAQNLCEKCKRKKPKHIHHKLPIRYFDKLKDAHSPENLIALCTACHVSEHRRLKESIPLIDLMYQSKRS